MQDFGVREAAQILGLSERQVRRYVQDGFLSSRRGDRGAHRFGFQDLVLLRTAKSLIDARVPSRKIRRALAALRDRLPEGQPLSGFRVALEGEELVVRDPQGVWVPESGQAVFDFSLDELYSKVEPFEGRLFDEGPPPIDLEDEEGEGWPIGFPLLAEDEFRSELPSNVSVLPVSNSQSGSRVAPEPDDEAAEMRCSEWMELAEALDGDRRPTQARDALRRGLEQDPHETEARRRLGCLLEQEGRFEAAESQLRLARRIRPDGLEIALDHGRLLAHLGDLKAALEAFQAAMSIDATCDEAFLGAANVHERLGQPGPAAHLLDQLRRRRRDPPED